MALFPPISVKRLAGHNPVSSPPPFLPAASWGASREPWVSSLTSVEYKQCKNPQKLQRIPHSVQSWIHIPKTSMSLALVGPRRSSKGLEKTEVFVQSPFSNLTSAQSYDLNSSASWHLESSRLTSRRFVLCNLYFQTIGKSLKVTTIHEVFLKNNNTDSVSV
jgi:hypothetical protein